MTDSTTLSFTQKHAAFFRRHGYSFKAYLLALVLLPPAAVLIGMKMDNVALPWRVIATLFVFILHGAILLGGVTLLIGYFG